jgi:hypothetical protein
VGFTPKPLKGSAKLERRDKVNKRHRVEQAEMQAAKKRDGGKCRFPHCRLKELVVDAAHLEHRGPGGNPAGDRTKVDSVISLCRQHHSMFDRHDMAITPLTERGTDGPCEFRWRDGHDGPMTRYAVERTFRVSETRT